MPSEKRKTVFIETLGCPKNRVDSEVLERALFMSGWRVVGKPHDAEAVVINTCGFIEDAKAESIETVWEFIRAKEAGLIETVVVTGCLAERYAQVLGDEMPELDVVLGNRDPRAIVRAMEASRNVNSQPLVSTPEAFLADWYEDALCVGNRPWAFVKVTEGCDNRCSYCAIPAIRGGLRSAPLESIVARCRQLVENGTRELVLVGQDTTAFGLDSGENRFPELLRSISAIDGDFWIRVMYSHPRNLTEKNISALAETPKVAPYLDLPIQHISDGILDRMGRHTDGNHIRRIVRDIEERISGIALRTSVIVGFPGETDADFDQLVEFLDEGHFIHGGVFAYSPEDGTPSALFQDSIDGETVAERKLFVEMIFDRIRHESNLVMEGRTVRVLVESEGSRPGLIWGRTEFDAPEIDRNLRFRGEVEVGSFADVMIIRGSGFHLLGVQV